MEPEIRHGAKIGRFVVTGELGAGGMGVVYAAHDRELDRHVALKVLRAAAATDEERARMLREGQAMARVTHPNVITVYEVGIDEHLVFLAQELLDAGTLGQWLEAPHPHDEIIAKFVAAGHGLGAAHAAGLVHRDFKPDNVLLGTDGRVRVADFGLARALGPADEALTTANRANAARAQLDLSRSPMSQLTRTGAVMGTPMFMAPEQHKGDRADERSDQFAFCVALYQALYGAWPFAGKTAVALADAVIDGRMERPPAGNRVPKRLRRVLLRGLSKKPAARYPSMTALLADLTRPPSRRGRKLAIAVAGAGLVAAAVTGGYALRTHDEASHARPLTAFDPKTLTSHRGIEWMTTSIDRGLLDDAIEKYDMAGSLAQQAGEPMHAAIAWSSGALALALRGHLDLARRHLVDAEAGKGSDATAGAYVDLASAVVAAASGDLATAATRSAHCATALTATAPELAALCLEVKGDAASERGDAGAARAAYTDGLVLAKRVANPTRTVSLELALAALDLDAGKADATVARIAALKASAAEEGAASPEERASILLARAQLALGESQKALDALERVKLDALQAFAIRITGKAARGETYALLGDPDEGFGQLDAARTEAEQQGYVGLALAARLARVEALLATAAPDAAAAQKALAADARTRGYIRIARRAENAAQR